jgi:hypothetical protein
MVLFGRSNERAHLVSSSDYRIFACIAFTSPQRIFLRMNSTIYDVLSPL